MPGNNLVKYLVPLRTIAEGVRKERLSSKGLENTPFLLILSRFRHRSVQIGNSAKHILTQPRAAASTLATKRNNF